MSRTLPPSNCGFFLIKEAENGVLPGDHVVLAAFSDNAKNQEEKCKH